MDKELEMMFSTFPTFLFVLFLSSSLSKHFDVSFLKFLNITQRYTTNTQQQNINLLFFRPNGNTIKAIKQPRLHIELFDVVSFSQIPSVKIQHRYVHKIIQVRHDLVWSDIFTNPQKK